MKFNRQWLKNTVREVGVHTSGNVFVRSDGNGSLCFYAYGRENRYQVRYQPLLQDQMSGVIDVDVNCKMLAWVLTTAPDAELDIRQDGAGLILDGVNCHYEINGVVVNKNHWTDWSDGGTGNMIFLDQMATAKLMSAAVFTSSDRMRPALESIRMVTDGGWLWAEATDGMRLCRIRICETAVVMDKLLHAKSAKAIFKDRSRNYCILDMEGGVRVSSWNMQARVYDADGLVFPDIKVVIPKSYRGFATVSAPALVAAAKSLERYSRYLRLDFDDNGRIRINANNHETGHQAYVDIPYLAEGALIPVIALQSPYLIDVCKLAKSTVRLNINEWNTPMGVSVDDSEDVHVIMPINVDQI